MTVTLDLDQLKTFVAIAETGSFTRAADVVFKTQSAVSMQMRRLEERISKPIFARDGRASRLTEEGERLLGYARRMVRLSDETVAAFDDTELQGSVRLGTPDDYADRFLPEILARFARSNPRVEVSVICEPSSTLMEMSRQGEIDLAIVTACGEPTVSAANLLGSTGLGFDDETARCEGRGVAGLTTAKVLTEAGHEVEVLDKAPDVGGVWSRTRRYPGLTTQSPKAQYSFSDHPMPKAFPEWPSGAQVQEYLASYAAAKGLEPSLRLSTTVTSATPRADGGWHLETTAGPADYDRLVVANGVFCEPSMPDYDGADDFRAAGGRLLAGTELHDADQARGKHVLVVGYGKSACDVTVPISEVAAKDEFLNIKDVTRDDVLAAHRVPPQLLGVIPKNNGGFGDVRTANDVFFVNEIEPLMTRTREVNEWAGQEVIRFEDYRPSSSAPA